MLISPADTEKFYTEVQEQILARYNKTFDWSLKAKMMGRKAIEAARIFVEETGISDSLSAEDFLVEREAMLQSLFPTSELMPGMLPHILYFIFCNFSSLLQNIDHSLVSSQSFFIHASIAESFLFGGNELHYCRNCRAKRGSSATELGGGDYLFDDFCMCRKIAYRVPLRDLQMKR